MKRGKSKLLSDTDVKNCLRFIIHIFRQIFDGVGLDKQYRVHSLRATCLTKLMDANYPLPLIQQISGHSSIQTLSIYYRTNPKNIQNALETLNL